jgi:predicted Kef-type K+ transport protein
MFEIMAIGIALLFGLGVKQLGLPPLIGYLISGMLIFANADMVGLTEEKLHGIDSVAHIGVLLLLFTVGLKLNVKKVVQKEVIGTGLAHILISVFIFTGPIFWLFEDSLSVAVALAVALSFSSTVLAAKSLEEKNELKAFHGRVAIGILVIQDVIALIFLSIASGEMPTIWALSILFLPLLRPLVFSVLDLVGHDDLLVLFSVVFAVIVGGFGFEYVGLSSELGALVMGALIASHSKSLEISEKLWGIKELFLVAFFMSIGLKGLPSIDDVIFALTMVALLPLQAVAFFMLLMAFGLKSRTAFLAGVSLTSFSEFALIVAAIIMPQWIIPLSLCVALSFVVSSPVNRFSHQIFDKYMKNLSIFESSCRHDDEVTYDVGNASVLIIGMGRVGYSAYSDLTKKGFLVKGVDSDPDRVNELKKSGVNVSFADVEHESFWDSIRLKGVDYCVLSTSDHQSNLVSVKKLRENHFMGYIISHSLHKDQVDELMYAGSSECFLTMSEVGSGLASHIATKANV